MTQGRTLVEKIDIYDHVKRKKGNETRKSEKLHNLELKVFMQYIFPITGCYVDKEFFALQRAFIAVLKETFVAIKTLYLK